ncbi:ent-kaur-16-ene synthase, chloroplastic isoform X1 [Cinnamomum micranthum f. kanehirae]|uniref:Ent-kaur-16-ene synthase, chloroplastic isoform X1 n=1 Tax=Cinnamomum micranthum f. kanehirae TaxID=337451 RepID=A0A3S4PC92_9MAGN|nr:ent-kaur-16-ene synthase, chloroplastic isoform X1 [Cinnamomum micranthum f. kanehirae]
MFVGHPNNVLSKPKRLWSLSDSVSRIPASQMVESTRSATVCSIGLEERIREMFLKVELTASSYDTAWVAMVPSSKSPQLPCFPECVDWLLENQLPNGSWSLPHHHPLLIKDALSSTLACVLALKRWSIGKEHVEKGLHFIGSNFVSTSDERQYTPIGFDVIFPGMIEYAENMGLNLPLNPVSVDAMLHKRDLEFRRNSGSEGGKVYLAYVAEGLGKLQDWKEVMKYQRKNGSLFNSPSTTAAALTHLKDGQCLEYLRSLLKVFGNAVPTTYPLDKYTQLHMIDKLEKLGIARHFSKEIKGALDETYRCWLQHDEEIYLDISTFAMAFRLLRMNGYNISSDALAQFAEEEFFFDSLGCHIKDLSTVLELYIASQIMTCSKELVLEKLNSWSSHFLQRELSKDAVHVDGYQNYIKKEVDYALKFPCYANLERLYHRRYIEHYDVQEQKILKTSYTSSNIGSKDILELAVKDFDFCQVIYREELEHLDRWVKENRLDQLKFARQKLTYCYFSAAATLFSPDLSDARMSWAKNGVLTTVVDDFYDIGGSREELVNLIQLVEKWDGNSATASCSDQVKIIFSAIYHTVNELGVKAYSWQGRNVTHHIIEIWLDLLKSMMKEAEWQLNKSVPTVDEYMKNAYVSFALGPIVLPALYFVGPKLPEEFVRCSEYHTLFRLMSTCGRLLNDMQTFQREGKEGKLNGVALRMFHGHGVSTEEEATSEMRGLIDSTRRELLGMVLETKGSLVPRECKDWFWRMSRVLHLFYMRNDGFTSPKEMVSAVNAVIHEPLNPP